MTTVRLTVAVDVDRDDWAQFADCGTSTAEVVRSVRAHVRSLLDHELVKPCLVKEVEVK